MNKLRQAALDYAAKGWPIFPCKFDKSPYTTNGLYDATTNPETINGWWDAWPNANIGFCPGDVNMVGVDYDPGHDLKELYRNVGELPATLLSQRTPRDGRHDLYGLAPGEIVASSASKLAKHIDVRSFGGYILLTPSKTKDGSYSWISEGKPAYRTDELIRVCNSAREKSGDRDKWIIEPDLNENVALAVTWLTTSAKVAIEGQGGDMLAYQTAAMMKSYGISKEVAFELLWEHWNPRCVPPWSAEDAEHLSSKIEHAYSYNTSPPGNMTNAYHIAKKAEMFSAVTRKEPIEGQKGDEWTSGRFRFVTRARMKTMKPPGMIIPDLIQEDTYAIMFGAPGTFKTFLALDIALSIAVGYGMGDQALHQEINSSGKVLFAAGEGRASLNERAQAWEDTHFNGNTVENFILADPVPTISEEIELFLAGAKEYSETYKLIVIDTLGRAMQGTNENAQENASAFTAMVGAIKYEFGCSVLALHHSGKANKGEMRGSSAFAADADTVIHLDRPDKNYVVGYQVIKQKDGKEWEEPRYTKLRVLNENTDKETLVVVKLEKGEATETETTSKRDQDRVIELDYIEEGLMEFLATNKMKEYSQKELAGILGANLKVSGQGLEKKVLTLFRESSTRVSTRCYLPEKKKWKWQS